MPLTLSERFDQQLPRPRRIDLGIPVQLRSRWASSPVS